MKKLFGSSKKKEDVPPEQVASLNETSEKVAPISIIFVARLSPASHSGQGGRMQQRARHTQKPNENCKRYHLQEPAAEGPRNFEKKKDVRCPTQPSHEPTIQCRSGSVRIRKHRKYYSNLWSPKRCNCSPAAANEKVGYGQNGGLV